MSKVSSGVISLAVACLVVALAMPSPASAGMTASVLGFPTIVHSGQALSFSNDVASNTDQESMSFDFPVFDGMMTRSGTPTIPASTMAGMTVPNLNRFGNLFDFGSFGLR